MEELLRTLGEEVIDPEEGNETVLFRRFQGEAG